MHLVLAIERIDVDDDSAGPQRCQEQDWVIGDIRQAERNAAAAHNSERLQSCCRSRDAPCEFIVGGYAAKKVDGGPGTVTRDGRVKHLGQQSRFEVELNS